MSIYIFNNLKNNKNDNQKIYIYMIVLKIIHLLTDYIYIYHDMFFINNVNKIFLINKHIEKFNFVVFGYYYYFLFLMFYSL